MTKTPSAFRVVYHGIKHEQYFQGHGVAFSRSTDCATGIGHSEIEALNDALESLAQNDWDVSVIETKLESEIANLEKMRVAQETELDARIHDGCGDDCGVYYHVSIDVGED